METLMCRMRTEGFVKSLPFLYFHSKIDIVHVFNDFLNPYKQRETHVQALVHKELG
jgi:hypothetical protein